jgi:hypothetical protein
LFAMVTYSEWSALGGQIGQFGHDQSFSRSRCWCSEIPSKNAPQNP